MPPLEVGMSPCPNDTFMFHGLVHGGADPGHAYLPVMLDIEQLNERALGPAPLPVTKLSVPVLAKALDRYAVLDAGAALGRGVGPLVVARREMDLSMLEGRSVAIPGELTTAWLLLRIFGPLGMQPVAMRFDRILAAVADGTVDAGLIIHESRFTYQAQGLVAIADLGDLWERDTGLPLPLGLIAALRSVGATQAQAIGEGLARSVRMAFDDPGASAAWVREHAQEMDPEVCRQHIELYVNRHSISIGSEGRRAVLTLLDRGRQVGALVGEGVPRDQDVFWGA